MASKPLSLADFQALGEIRLKNGECINVSTDEGIITVSNNNRAITCSCLKYRRSRGKMGKACPHTKDVRPLIRKKITLKLKKKEQKEEGK